MKISCDDLHRNEELATVAKENIGLQNAEYWAVEAIKYNVDFKAGLNARGMTIDQLCN